MNIQIYGKSKCFDTKKAERYFKERNIRFQSIDILKYSLSKGEYAGVKKAVGCWRFCFTTSRTVSPCPPSGSAPFIPCWPPTR